MSMSLVLLLVLTQTLAEERFEQPLGGDWSVPGASAVSAFGLTAAAAQTGARGAQFDKPDAGPSRVVTLPALALGLNGPLPGELHFRLWFNLLAGPTTLRVSPLQVGQGSATFTLGELYVDEGGAGTWQLSCADDSNGFRDVVVPVPVVRGQWSLLELDLEGVGTANGTCRGAVDGVEASLGGFGWSGRGATLLVTGFNVVDDAWKGSYAIDDFTFSRSRSAMRTRVVGPSVVDAGSCAPYQVDFLARDGGVLAPPATARFFASASGGALFTDSTCTTGVAPTRALTSAEVAALYFGVSATSATIDVRSNDLLGATKMVTAIAVDGGNDAGASDAGSRDGGADGSQRLQVGCGCGSVGPLGVGWLVVALALSPRPLRRRRLPPKGAERVECFDWNRRHRQRFALAWRRS